MKNTSHNHNDKHKHTPNDNAYPHTMTLNLEAWSWSWESLAIQDNLDHHDISFWGLLSWTTDAIVVVWLRRWCVPIVVCALRWQPKLLWLHCFRRLVQACYQAVPRYQWPIQKFSKRQSFGLTLALRRLRCWHSCCFIGTTSLCSASVDLNYYP